MGILVQFCLVGIYACRNVESKEVHLPKFVSGHILEKGVVGKGWVGCLSIIPGWVACGHCSKQDNGPQMKLLMLSALLPA